jgi:hypothetical protein
VESFAFHWKPVYCYSKKLSARQRKRIFFAIRNYFFFGNKLIFYRVRFSVSLPPQKLKTWFIIFSVYILESQADSTCRGSGRKQSFRAESPDAEKADSLGHSALFESCLKFNCVCNTWQRCWINTETQFLLQGRLWTKANKLHFNSKFIFNHSFLWPMRTYT